MSPGRGRKSILESTGVTNISHVPTALAGLLRGDDRGLTDEDAERRLERRRLPTKRRVLTHYDHVCKCIRYTCDRMWMHLDIVCATGTRLKFFHFTDSAND